MKLSWIFGSSMEAHHLLYAYLTVWLVQGGYATWIAVQWMRTRKAHPPVLPVVARDPS